MPQRKYFIGGNWKSNGSVAAVKSLVAALNSGTWPEEHVEVIVAPIAIHLGSVRDTLRAPYQVASQNCSLTDDGAYTGEISATALLDFGIKFVILGHSERRQLFSESNEIVAAKVDKAIKCGLHVIACIGETLKQREAEETFEVLNAQLAAISTKLNGDWSRVIVAYEPVWAIGTGMTASPAQAQEVHAWIRQWVHDNVTEKTASAIRIIYGGSVKPSNAKELIKQEDVDGFLVGGASLNAAEFLPILKSVQSAL